MDFSDAPARVRLNMRRCHSERPKQRRVWEDPVGEVMIGENLANEAVERQWSEVSATEFERLAAQRIFGETERASITRRFDEHAGSEFVNKEFFLKEQDESVKARLAMKLFNTWQDESKEFYAGAVMSTPTAHTFFSCAVCQRSCPRLLSQFVLQVVSRLVIDSTHTRGSSTT